MRRVGSVRPSCALAVDTASPRLSLALRRDRCVATWTGNGGSPDYAAELVPQFSALMKQLRVVPNDIAAIVINRGPGSFTGLRVGITFVRMIAAYTRARVYAADTFALLLQALGKKPLTSRLIAVCAAVKREVYLREYRTDGRGWYAVQKPACETVEQFRARCAADVEPVLIVDDTAAAIVPDEIRGRVVRVPRQALALLELLDAPRTSASSFRAVRVAPASLSPLYIRSPYY